MARRSYYEGPDYLAPFTRGYYRRHVVTFKGWEGKWWKRLKPLKSLRGAVLSRLPFKYSVAYELGMGGFNAVRSRRRRTVAGEEAS